MHGFLFVGDVLESVVHESAGAARVNLVALNELLLGEGLEGAGGDLDGALEGTDGGESLARAALGLVLHGGHGALGCPVDGGGSRGVDGGDSGV